MTRAGLAGKRDWRARTLAVALLAVLAALAACASGSADPEATYSPHKAATLTAGTLDGQPWSLTASMNVDEGLCLAVNPTAAPSAGFTSGDCGFGASTQQEIARGSIREDVGSAETGSGQQLVYGPAPARTTRVVIHSFALEATGSSGTPPNVALPGCHENRPASISARSLHPLPRWAGNGQWFVVSAPDNGCGYNTATFYDRAGKVVPKQRF